MNHPGIFAAVVLAAGRGSRMGRQKALMEWKGQTFLYRVVNSLRPVNLDSLVVILGFEHERVFQNHRMLDDVTFLVNDHPEDGMISSLRCALKKNGKRWRAIMMTLVDHPAISTDTYRRVKCAADEHPDSVIIPSYKGRRGHPVVFPACLFDELLHPDLPRGARTVLSRHQNMVIEIPVDDCGIVLDIDTLDDLHKLKKHLK